MNNKKKEINENEKKICSKCLIDKTLNNFSDKKRSKDGKNYHCIECGKLENHLYYKRCKELKVKAFKYLPHYNQPRGIFGKTKFCSVCEIEKSLENFVKNKSQKDGHNYRCKQCWKIYYSKNKNKLIKCANDYYKDNKEKKKKYDGNYQKNKIKDPIKTIHNRKRDKDRYHNDTQYKLVILLRTRISNFLRNTNKHNSSKSLLGCPLNEYKEYLENQFYPEMTWGNHGKVWEIDHIKPCSKFDLTIEEEQNKCFNYKNTRPLFKTTSIAESFGYNNIVGNRNKDK